VTARPDAAAPVRAAALECPQCGAGIPQRALGYARTIACEHCTAVLDADQPALRILKQAQERQRRPKIWLELGARATLAGRPWEVIGVRARAITVEGVAYEWREYVLFNPVHGFRYLTEYDGRWSWVEPLRRVPEVNPRGSQPTARLDGTTHKHFQTADAVTRFVLGEFPWEVRVGDRVTCSDYVAPPSMLSSEQTGHEQSWSRGTYLPSKEVREAFGLKSLPAPKGVYAHQPNPVRRRLAAMWPIYLATLAAVVVLTLAWQALGARERVFYGEYVYQPSAGAEPAADAFVTDTFVVRGRPSNLALTWDASILNSWIYIDVALIDHHRGTAQEFGRELSYYRGSDSDGPWTEGKQQERVLVPSVPPGTYYLRIDPSAMPGSGPIRYTVRLTRDVPSLTFPLIVLVLATLPMGIVWLKSHSFETKRWMESDHAPASSGDDEE
jgi:hypothetical protein